MKKMIPMLLMVCLLTFSMSYSPSDSAYAFSGGTAIDLNQNTLGEYVTKDKREVYYYRFTTSSVDSWYNITLRNTNIETRIYASVYDQNDVEQFRVDTGYNEESKISRKLNISSSYYIKVYRSSESKIGKFQISLNEIQDDVADNKEISESLALGTAVPRVINSYKDVDCYKFTTTNNDSWYDLSLTNTNTDTSLYAVVYDQNDVEIYKINAYMNEMNHNQYKLNKNTIYYVKVYGYNQERYGKYRLKVTEIQDDVSDNKDNAISLKLGSSLTKLLNGKADQDWYKIKTTNKDSWYGFELRNVNIDSYLYLYLYDENDVQVKQSTAYFNGKEIVYMKLDHNKTYFIKIYGYNEWKLGKYQLKISENVDDAKDTFEKTTKLTLNKTYKKKINAFDDVDCFNFKTNKKSTNYEISVFNKLNDHEILVEIFDADDVRQGSMYVYAKGSRSMLLKLNRNKTYYLRISGAHSIGSYQMKIS